MIVLAAVSMLAFLSGLALMAGAVVARLQDERAADEFERTWEL